MTDKLRDAAQQALEALDNMTDSQSNPARRNFPTIHDYGKSRRAADALRAALAQQDTQAVPQGDKGTPGAWFVRKLVRDGELKDCFVAAPSFDGMPYDAEILGDDEYRDGVERKLADCELIVAAVNALRAAPTPPAQEKQS